MRGLDTMILVYNLLQEHPALTAWEQLLLAHSDWFTSPWVLFEAKGVLTKVYGEDSVLATQKLAQIAGGPIVLLDLNPTGLPTVLRLSRFAKVFRKIPEESQRFCWCFDDSTEPFLPVRLTCTFSLLRYGDASFALDAECIELPPDRFQEGAWLDEAFDRNGSGYQLRRGNQRANQGYPNPYRVPSDCQRLPCQRQEDRDILSRQTEAQPGSFVVELKQAVAGEMPGNSGNPPRNAAVV
jgi:hypothetical protein